MLQPVLEATQQKTVELVEDETVEREAALTQLNDTLQSPIGDVVFLRQHEIAEMAVQYHPGIPHRLLTPMEWHDTIFTSGFTLAEWFQRKSPSRWMCDILSHASQNSSPPNPPSKWLCGAAAITEEFSWNSTQRMM